ncbi:MAG: patatin-like phospholipase family protein [Cryobacterium sp.]|nr:patatin-like phospholipase family protein [Oligoflexia bacterium]
MKTASRLENRVKLRVEYALKIAVFLALVLCVGSNTLALAGGKPFQNSVILSGGGFKIGMHLGFYHAMLDAGISPDLIIGTCGGGITAGIIEKFPNDPNAQEDFLLSEKSFHLLGSVDSSPFAELAPLIGTKIQALVNLKKKRYPDFVKRYVFNVPQDLGLFGDLKFSPRSSTKNFATIIQATEFDGEARDIVQRRKVRGREFAQVYFTDSETANALAGFESPISFLNKSRIQRQTRTVSDVKVDDAVRAGMSDPFLMAPKTINGKIYLTGGTDVFPLEMAEYLSENAHYFYRNGLSPIMDRLFKAVFGFFMVEKVFKVQKDDETLMWDTELTKEEAFEPKIRLSQGGMGSAIPAGYADYHRLMLAQYEKGYSAATRQIFAHRHLKPAGK